MNGGTYNEGISEINNMFSLLKSFCILANENKDYIGSFHLGFNIDRKNMLQGEFLTQEINRKTHDFIISLQIGLVFYQKPNSREEYKKMTEDFAKFNACVDICSKVDEKEYNYEFFEQFKEYMCMVITSKNKYYTDFILLSKFDNIDYLIDLFGQPNLEAEEIINDKEILFYQNTKSKLDNEYFPYIEQISNEKINSILGFQYTEF